MCSRLCVVLEVLILIMANGPLFLLTGTTANQCSPDSVTVPSPLLLQRSGKNPIFSYSLNDFEIQFGILSKKNTTSFQKAEGYLYDGKA